VHPENERFWESLGEGQFRLQECSACGTRRFPLAPCCFACLSLRYDWKEIAATGRVSAAITVHRATGDAAWAGAVPFLTGVVDLDAGLRLPGRLLCHCGLAARHGTPVTLVSIPTTGPVSAYAFEHSCHAGDRS
jgi:uncharacterized OB-fold protein